MYFRQMSGLARNPNAHGTPSRGDTNHCTSCPRSKRTMHRTSPLVSDIDNVNQSPTTFISASAARRSRKRCSQLSENMSPQAPRAVMTCSWLRLRLNVLVDPGDDHVGKLKVVAILHQHVTVATDAEFGKMHHLRVSAGRFH